MGTIPGSGEGRSARVERSEKKCACGSTEGLQFSTELGKWVCADCRRGVSGI